ncbi:MAG: pyruvate kinase [Christensenellaceae bacterium]|jgi:pyruvate kinase|nr:pyruvate kinase [Christensenellaceae bacterium]
MKKTKTICTLGPATSDYQTILGLIKNGMNVARLNMSHGNLSTHQKSIDMVKQARLELGVPCAIMLDTRGPEIRIGHFSCDKIILKRGDLFTFTSRQIDGDQNEVSINFPPIIKGAKVGGSVFANSGLLEFKIIEVTKTDIICKVVEGGELSSYKNFAVPRAKIDMPYLSETDKEHIKFAAQNNLEFVACSFVGGAEDVRVVKKYIASLGGDMEIISKIESEEGINNLEEIIDESHGIMIARGDMGTEIPIAQIPSVQKHIINSCTIKGKPVIVATEMLESMTEKTRPTRAEAADVAAAVFDGTCATMLSGETAVGVNPVGAAKTMSSIADVTEQNIDYDEAFVGHFKYHNALDAVSYSACAAAMALKAKVIVCFTQTGRTVKRLSRFRPAATILAVTYNPQVYNTLSLSWGVLPVLTPAEIKFDNMFETANQLVKDLKLAKRGDVIIITTGSPTVHMGPTNMIKISEVE